MHAAILLAAMEERDHAPAVARARLVDEVPDDLAAEWQALAQHASEPNPFAEPWFVAASLRHLGGGPVHLVECRTGGRLDGVILLGREARYGRTPVAHLQNWRHHHHFLGTPLVRRGREDAFWTALLAVLDAADWAPGFLHLRDLNRDGALHHSLAAIRTAPIVYREERALLDSDLSPDGYYEAVVRKKKRKELARLRNRLAELGPLVSRSFGEGDDLAAWCDDFLELERSGWKGREGSALACRSDTAAFFHAAVSGARGEGRLQLLRLDLGERPLAMLVNFLTPPGSFSFKTAFDEEHARFSPGVHIQRDNLAILDRPDIAWMDSCAAADHPMIDSLWAERRSIVRVTVPLAGARRRLAFAAARALEQASAARRRLAVHKPAQQEAHE